MANSANGVSKITRRGCAPWRSAARGMRVVRPDGGKDNRSRGEGCVNSLNLGLARRTLCIVHQSLAHTPSSRSTNQRVFGSPPAPPSHRRWRTAPPRRCPPPCRRSACPPCATSAKHRRGLWIFASGGEMPCLKPPDATRCIPFQLCTLSYLCHLH
jgi:hypothetical protein